MVWQYVGASVRSTPSQLTARVLSFRFPTHPALGAAHLTTLSSRQLTHLQPDAPPRHPHCRCSTRSCPYDLLWRTGISTYTGIYSSAVLPSDSHSTRFAATEYTATAWHSLLSYVMYFLTSFTYFYVQSPRCCVLIVSYLLSFSVYLHTYLFVCANFTTTCPLLARATPQP